MTGTSAPPNAAGLEPALTRRRALLLFAALALAAALVDLGRMHLHEHGDSIVPVLVSLQRWTPFYWDQERYGMLVPLLALPFRDPLANLLVQRGLLVLAGLAAVVLVARHLLARGDWPLAGALAVGLLLLLAPDPWAFEYLGDQPYGLSMALALGGLALAEPRADGPGRGGGRWARLAAGALLVVAAHWVNAATALVLLPLAAARAVADRLEQVPARTVRRRFAVDAALLLSGLALGYAWIRVYPLVTGHPLRLAMGLLPPSAWPGAWAAFLGNAWAEGAGWACALAAIAAGGAAWLLADPALRPAAPEAFLRAGALVGAAVAYALVAGALRWVAENGSPPRYFAPSAVLVHLAAVSLVSEPVARLGRAARPAFLAAVALVPAAALAAGGAPSVARVRADLDAALGGRTADVRAAGCQLVTGDYWTVWPTVWHALEVAHARGEPPRIWGVCYRSNPTVPQWRDIPRAALRVCVPLGEEAHAGRWLRSFHLWPVREVGRQGTVRVVVPAAAPSAAGGAARSADVSPAPPDRW